MLRTVRSLNKRQIKKLLNDWQIWARDDQLAPNASDAGQWRTWLLLGGRGAGKTRAGAEWIRSKAAGAEDGALRIALVGETLRDVRSVMIEGISGLLAVHDDNDRPKFEPSNKQLAWANGSKAQLFSAEDPDSLRGPQFHFAWCDEIAKWRYPEKTWDMLQFGLRLGETPQQIVTTTPRPIRLLRELLADTATVVSRAQTFDNRAHLSTTFLDEMQRRYGDSALGRQELLGEIINETTGALWRRAWIDGSRVSATGELGRTVVAIDPPVTATATSDYCGIVAAAQGRDQRFYVLSDASIQGRSPDGWARAAIELYHKVAADCLVAEVNQGGDMVAAVLAQVAPSIPVKKVRATRGKWLRAEPIAALYSEGRVSHVGMFQDLEEQMLTFGVGGLSINKSPDRLDALVWALTELMSQPLARPALRYL